MLAPTLLPGLHSQADAKVSYCLVFQTDFVGQFPKIIQLGHGAVLAALEHSAQGDKRMSRIRELTLLGSLLILIGAGVFCLACGTSTCTLMACASTISISLTNDAGEEVNEATMTANIDDAELTLTCPAAAPYTCPNAMLDQNAVSLCCGHDGQGAGFSLGNAIGPGYEITVDVTSVDGDHYSGPLQVEITTQEDFNGPGCGTCSNGRADVVLQ